MMHGCRRGVGEWGDGELGGWMDGKQEREDVREDVIKRLISVCTGLNMALDKPAGACYIRTINIPPNMHGGSHGSVVAANASALE